MSGLVQSSLTSSRWLSKSTSCSWKRCSTRRLTTLSVSSSISLLNRERERERERESVCTFYIIHFLEKSSSTSSYSNPDCSFQRMCAGGSPFIMYSYIHHKMQDTIFFHNFYTKILFPSYKYNVIIFTSNACFDSSSSLSLFTYKRYKTQYSQIILNYIRGWPTKSRHPLFSQLLAIFVAVCFAVSLRVVSSNRSLAW